jgi:alpha-mannosidase
LVALPAGVSGVTRQGAPLPVQEIEGEVFAEVNVPACGWTTLTPGEDVPSIPNALVATPTSLENELLRVVFNGNGEIVSLFDKEIARELAAGPCNSFTMYKDVPSANDAWDIDQTYVSTPVALPDSAHIDVVSAGPLVATLRMTRRLHTSTLTQEVRLRRGSRTLEFVTKIDWQERHKLLKVAFPVTLQTDEALHEIQFGHIRRPNHASRQFDADRFEVAQHKWTALAEENRGVAVLNDCKYGVNVVGNSINLTLLRAPLAPDMTADQGTQEFTYALYAWNGSFAASELVQHAYALNIPLTTAPGGAGERALFTVSAPNVVIETVKPAEDGSQDIIVRLYEAYRMATRCTLTTALPATGAIAVNMLEEGNEPLPFVNGAVELDFRAFEVKTVRIAPLR